MGILSGPTMSSENASAKYQDGPGGLEGLFIYPSLGPSVDLQDKMARAGIVRRTLVRSGWSGLGYWIERYAKEEDTIPEQIQKTS